MQECFIFNSLEASLMLFHSLINFSSLSNCKIGLLLALIICSIVYLSLVLPKCPNCSFKNRTLTTKKFIDKANKIHNFKYDYSLVKYINAKTKVKIICKNCNTIFEQLAYKHLDKRGCPKCCKVGYSRTEWINFCNRKKVLPHIYFIRCFNDTENFIKIGRTSDSVNFRFSGKRFPYSFEILKEIKGSPDFIYDKEIELHKIYKEYKYKPLLDFKGKTECFTLELLNLI